MENCLFIGNGINRVEKVGVSWEKLLQKIYKEDTKPISDSLGMTIRYEYIEAKSEEKPIESKRKVANEVAANSEIIKGKSISYHMKLMQLPINSVLTTNYDYSLELVVNPLFVPTRVTSETIYSFRRKHIVANKEIFHIHGECRYPQSICLGFEHYAGTLEKMRSGLSRGTSKDEGKNRFQLYDVLKCISEPGEEWYYKFFLDNIFFLGFGFDHTEEDIWWLITYRRKMMMQYPGLIKNRLVVLDTTLDSNATKSEENAKRQVFNAMNIEVISMAGRTRREKYKNAISFLENECKNIKQEQ